MSITIRVARTGPGYQGVYCRIPHDKERVNWNADDFRYRRNVQAYSLNPHDGPVRQVVIDTGDPMPEVYRVIPFHHVILDCYWQWIWRDMNYELSDKKWSTLMGPKLAWMNRPINNIIYNCITGEGKPVGEVLPRHYPRFDQARVCGGFVGKVKSIGKELVELDSLKTYDHHWTAEQIIRQPHLWFWGTSVNSKGQVNFIRRIAMNSTYTQIRIPFLTSEKAYLPLDELHMLPVGVDTFHPLLLA